MAQSLRQFFYSIGVFCPIFIGGLLLGRPPVREYCALFNTKNIKNTHTRIFQFCARRTNSAATHLCISSTGFAEGFKTIKLGFEKNTFVQTVPIKSMFRFPCFENPYAIPQFFDFFLKWVFSKISQFFRSCAQFFISSVSLANLWGVKMPYFIPEGFARRFFPKFNHISNIKIPTTPRFIDIGMSREG